MSTAAEEYSEQKAFFVLAALMFFAIPIRFPDPESRTHKEFRNFIVQFNRTYHGNATEYQRRYEIFKKTFEMVEDMRQDSRPVFGINRYSDMPEFEFRRKYLLAESSPRDHPQPAKNASARHNGNNFGIGPAPIPERVDWRERGVVTPIRNQGPCGSCYAHSVVATVEAMHALKWNLTAAKELSVQQMLDCAGNANFGCRGGDTCQLLGWMKGTNVSILPKEVYAAAGRGRGCHMSSALRRLRPSDRTARVTDYRCFSFVGQEFEMLAYLAFKGPLVASVNALPWKHYVGGVISSHCDGPAAHAVQIVGYDLRSSEGAHFIVRNSWGTEFGDRGYAKIAVGGNVCGIAEEVSSVTVD